MNNIKASILLLISSALVGCGDSAEEKLRELLISKSNLIDPKSAEFRNIKTDNKMSQFCGEINAKNSLGGYVGWTHFYATTNDSSGLYFEEFKNTLFPNNPYHFAIPSINEFCNSSE